MADRKRLRRQSSHETLDRAAGLLFQDEWREKAGVEIEHQRLSSRALRSSVALGPRQRGILARKPASDRTGCFGCETADKWAIGRPWRGMRTSSPPSTFSSNSPQRAFALSRLTITQKQLVC